MWDSSNEKFNGLYYVQFNEKKIHVCYTATNNDHRITGSWPRQEHTEFAPLNSFEGADSLLTWDSNVTVIK